MKKLSFCIVLLLIAAFVALPYPVAAQTPTPTPEPELTLLNQEEIQAIQKNAQEVILAACNLDTPHVEGLPVDMQPFEDWVRQSFCVTTTGFVANAWSAWPGSPGTAFVNQEHLADWVMIRGGKQLLSKKDVVINNPKTQGPPVSLFGWAGHCGPQQDYYVALVRHHAWQDGLNGKLEMDFSWRFTLPSTTCKLYMPFLNRPVPPPPPPACPTDWKILISTPSDDVVLKYTTAGDTRNFVMQLTEGQKLIIETLGPGGIKASLPNGGKTSISLNGNVVYVWTEPHKEFVGGRDLLFYTYVIRSEFPWSGLTCWNQIQLYDPPKLAAQLLEKYPGMSPEEAYNLALEIIQSEIESTQ